MSDPKSKSTLAEGSGVTSVAESLTENAIIDAEEAIIEEMGPGKKNPPPPEESSPPPPQENPPPPEENPPPPVENLPPPEENPPPPEENPPPPEENPPPPEENPPPPEENPPPPIENIFSNTGATAKVSKTEQSGSGPPGFVVPTVLVDMKGNITFEGGGPPVSFSTTSEKESGVNVMLPVQMFPSMSQTALQVQSPESFARHNTIPMESEVGLASVYRQGAQSHITDETVAMSKLNIPGSSSEAPPQASNGPVVIGMSIHVSQQVVPFDDPKAVEETGDTGVPAEVVEKTSSYAKATSSDPHVLVVVDGQDPSANDGIPVRRTQSAPQPNGTRRKSVLEKLPEDAKSSLRYQLQEIHVHLTLLMQELVRAEDQVITTKKPPDDKQE